MGSGKFLEKKLQLWENRGKHVGSTDRENLGKQIPTQKYDQTI